MNKGTSIVGFLLCFLAGMGLMYGVDHKKGGDSDVSADSSASNSPAGAWSDDAAPIPVDSKDPMWGNRNAPVTVVIFSDYQCPFCSRVEPTLDQIKTTYGKDKVRLVWKNEPLPFHPNAKPAAIAGQAVFAAKGNDAFWKFHDTAFKNQQQLGDDSYAKWAAEAGVDAATFAKFKADPAVAKKVEDDAALASKVGANGTPHFFINGVELSGAQPFDKFKEQIDAQLEKAKGKQASGVKPDKMYVALSQESFKAPAAQPANGDQNKKPAPDQKPKEDDNTVWKVAIGDSPVLGSDSAPVTIVEFSDFQCPFCKRVEDTLQKVKDTYKDKVRWVWKNEPLPFHPRALPAAYVALLAKDAHGSKGFWDAHDKLFASAPKLEDADLEAVVKDLGLDPAKWHDALAKNKWKDSLDAEQNQADDLNASGTPHFFVNGIRLVGAQPFEKFQEVIDAQLKVADGLKAKGIAPNKIYDEIMKTGKEPPPPEKKDNVGAPSSDNPWKGGKSAKVIIQEFSDFQCPFCSRVEPTVKQVMDTYGDKVKFVWRNKPLPFHADAPLASEAAMEAFKQKGNDGFWKMHDTLFEKQKDPDGIKRPALEKYASDMGLDMTKFKAALDGSTHKDVIDKDNKTGDDAGISGTPAFVINGYYISGAQPFSKFKKAIDRALKEAKLGSLSRSRS